MTAALPYGRKVLPLIPPEGVPIAFVQSTMGSRIGAQLLDILFTYGGVFLLLLAAVYTGILSFTGLITLFALLTFLVRVPYYILTELIWNGRTPGKRIVGIRVISLDGRSLTPHQIVARNVMKEVEVFLPVATLFGADNLTLPVAILLVLWTIGVVIVPFANRRNQRLGDMVAGTMVVETPKPRLLPDLSAQDEAQGYQFDLQHLDIYGRYELQTLEAVLRDPPRTPEAKQRVSDVAQTIRRRIAYDEAIPAAREWMFLTAFYRQQRAHLESRNLFGDARENKHHAKGRKS